jgi:hypothetical protein
VIEAIPPIVAPTIELIKILTRDTIMPSGHPPSVRTQVHRLHIAESVTYDEEQPVPYTEPLTNVVNALEIRQFFVIVDSSVRRKGKIALHEECKFVGIENIHGDRLPESEYRVEITKSPECLTTIRIDTKRLLGKQKWLSGSKMFCLVSSTVASSIFDRYLRTEELPIEEEEKGRDFQITPQEMILPNGVKDRVEYRGGCLYHECFIRTQYGGYYNLDEGRKKILHPLACAITIFEGEHVYRMDLPSGPDLWQGSRAGRVYSLGELTTPSRKGIILTETDHSRVILSKWDLGRDKVGMQVYSKTPALPASQEKSASGQ